MPLKHEQLSPVLRHLLHMTRESLGGGSRARHLELLLKTIWCQGSLRRSHDPRIAHQHIRLTMLHLELMSELPH